MQIKNYKCNIINMLSYFLISVLIFGIAFAFTWKVNFQMHICK
jgi:hypothetical protein